MPRVKYQFGAKEPNVRLSERELKDLGKHSEIKFRLEIASESYNLALCFGREDSKDDGRTRVVLDHAEYRGLMDGRTIYLPINGDKGFFLSSLGRR